MRMCGGDDWKKALTDLGKDADITLTSDERFQPG